LIKRAIFISMARTLDKERSSLAVTAVTVIFPPCDEDYGMRDFGIETPDGHRLNFGSPR